MILWKLKQGMFVAMKFTDNSLLSNLPPHSQVSSVDVLYRNPQSCSSRKKQLFSLQIIDNVKILQMLILLVAASCLYAITSK